MAASWTTPPPPTASGRTLAIDPIDAFYLIMLIVALNAPRLFAPGDAWGFFVPFYLSTPFVNNLPKMALSALINLLIHKMTGLYRTFQQLILVYSQKNEHLCIPKPPNL